MMVSGTQHNGGVSCGFMLIGADQYLMQCFMLTQKDYTGVETTSDCYKCSNPSDKNCTCKLEFSLSNLFEVT